MFHRMIGRNETFSYFYVRSNFFDVLQISIDCRQMKIYMLVVVSKKLSVCNFVVNAKILCPQTNAIALKTYQ